MTRSPGTRPRASSYSYGLPRDAQDTNPTGSGWGGALPRRVDAAREIFAHHETQLRRGREPGVWPPSQTALVWYDTLVGTRGGPTG